MEKKIKFNFVDIAIVAIVIIVAVLGWVVLGGGSASDAGKEFSYEILFREVPETEALAVQKGADIFDGIKIINIGTISDVSYKESVKYEFNSITGEYDEVKVPERYNLTVKVSAAGSCDGLACLVNEYEVYVGKTADVKSIGFVGHGVITTVEEGE